jgi:hypothetical protein
VAKPSVKACIREAFSQPGRSIRPDDHQFVQPEESNHSIPDQSQGSLIRGPVQRKGAAAMKNDPRHRVSAFSGDFSAKKMSKILKLAIGKAAAAL